MSTPQPATRRATADWWDDNGPLVSFLIGLVLLTTSLVVSVVDRARREDTERHRCEHITGQVYAPDGDGTLRCWGRGAIIPDSQEVTTP